VSRPAEGGAHTAPLAERRTERRRFGLRAVGLTVGGPGLALSEALELARAAEDAGLELLGAGDGFVENLAVMGALAASTRAAELYTCIMGWTRTPVTMALAGLTMAELSRGRYRLGFGTMPRRWSEDWHDVDASRPVARMRDFVAAVRTASASRPGAPVSYQGEFYRFEDYERPSPAHAAPPPIYLAATRPRMAELAAEIADGAIFNLIDSPEWISEVCWGAIEAGLARAGRAREAFDVGILLYCAIDEDRRRAIEMVRPALAFYFAVPYFGAMLEHHGMAAELRAGREAAARGDRAAMAAAVSDEMVRTFALAGTADEVREQLQRYSAMLDWALLAAPILGTVADTRMLARRIITTFAPV
jgi:alkanesulfonate monooxygenase SsuD/methylene tetrahydromethanopterin reductase-like flavin-dependent oxidoreductase (luciferase family)